MQMLKGFVLGVVATVCVVTAWISYGDGMGHLFFTTSITASIIAIVCAFFAAYKFLLGTDRKEKQWFQLFGIMFSFGVVMFLISALYTH